MSRSKRALSLSDCFPNVHCLLQAAQKLAAGKPKCEDHAAKHGSSWQPSRFVSLCDQVAGSKDAELRAFCEGVMAAELKLLLQYCYAHL
jgi:hypothetical protein